MFGLAQLTLTDSPFVPERLAGLAMVTVFLGQGDDWFVDPSDRPNGDGWEVRAYDSLDMLVPADGPILDGIEPRQLDWELVDDYPAYEELEAALGDDVDLDKLLDGAWPGDVIGIPVEGPKLGGWPSTIQGELSWAVEEHPAAPAFCIQIDADKATNLAPLGSGVLYLGLGAIDDAPVWVATTQYP